VKFLDFLATPIDKRDEWLQKNEGEPGAPPVSGEQPPEPPKSPEPPKPEGATLEPWWKARGYESEQQAVEAIDKLKDVVAVQKQQVDRFNAERGKIGKHVVDLETEIEDLKKAQPAPSKPEAKPRPQRPKRPLLKDFENDALDANYHNALAEYEAKLESYEKELEDYLVSIKPNGFEDMEKRLDSITKKAEASFKHVETEAQKEAREAGAAAYDDMWKEAEAIQADYDLKTSVPPRTINEYMLALDPKNDKVFTADQKAEARKFMDSLSPADKKRFDGLAEIINVMYGFDSGAPTRKYRTREAAMIDHGLHTKYKKAPTDELTQEERAALLEKQRKDREETVSALPASSLQSGDRPIGAGAGEKDIERLKVLARKYKDAVDAGVKFAEAFEASPDFAEFKTLRMKLGNRLPDSPRYR
jgi:hypothetical protein